MTARPIFHQHRANFTQLQRTLMNQTADFIPLIELGIDRSIKEGILGHRITSLADDIDFMQKMGYDFIKIQPHIELELNRQQSAADSATPDRAWSPEHQGIISSWESFESYRWPSKEDIDYTLFEEARSILPEGMGIIGQYGDIFTNVWELMGFENFAMAIYEQPDLISALFEKTAELILSMFDTMATMDWVGILWYSDDIAYSSNLMVSPQFLRTYFFPLLSRIGRARQGARYPLYLPH